MRTLLDTCVVSEIRRPQGAPEVKAAVRELAECDAFLSVVTLGEITSGVARLEQGRRRRELSFWLDGLERDFAERILPVDLETARLWGDLDAAARRAGHRVGVSDGLIGATAVRHGLRVMTRNVSDFAPLNVLIVNPWGDR